LLLFRIQLSPILHFLLIRIRIQLITIHQLKMQPVLFSKK
jgi:hypothetical protein